MKKKGLRPTKITSTGGTVISNEKIRSHFYRLSVVIPDGASDVFGRFEPGQFVEIELSSVGLPAETEIPEDLKDKAARQVILRRPFSLSGMGRLSSGSLCLEITYSVVGPATVRMTSLTKGQKLSITGPLGRGFSVPSRKSVILLVAGGMGSPPLLHLGRYLKANLPGREIIAFAGARSIDHLPFTIVIGKHKGTEILEFRELGIPHYIATDDGSVGSAGFISDTLAKWLDKQDIAPGKMIIYACGPRPMLAAVAAIANSRQIDCQISTEEMMACGIGLCQGCAVAVGGDGGGGADSSGQTEYKLCCRDGPVFDSRELVFE